MSISTTGPLWVPLHRLPGPCLFVPRFPETVHISPSRHGAVASGSPYRGRGIERFEAAGGSGHGHRGRHRRHLGLERAAYGAASGSQAHSGTVSFANQPHLTCWFLPWVPVDCQPSSCFSPDGRVTFGWLGDGAKGAKAERERAWLATQNIGTSQWVACCVKKCNVLLVRLVLSVPVVLCMFYG